MNRKNKPKIPRKAKIRILRELRDKQRIPTEHMLEIIAKETGADLSDRLVRTVWLGNCQQLMASIRDQDGQRLVFHLSRWKSVNKRPEYIIVAACKNQDELGAIRHRLLQDAMGLENSIAVVEAQIASITAIRAGIDRIISGLREDKDGE